MIALPTQTYYGFTVINLHTSGTLDKKTTKRRLYTADNNPSKHLQAVRKNDHPARDNDHPTHENLL